MTFRFSVTVDGVVFVAFEVLDVGLVDLGVLVLELDSFFLEPFFFRSWVRRNGPLVEWLLW